MKTRFAIGVDLGGTNLRVGIVRSDGRVEANASVPLGADKSAEGIATLIAEYVENIRKQKPLPVDGCGCGVPGIVDAGLGVVFSSPNFPEWKDVEFLKFLRKEIPLTLSPLPLGERVGVRGSDPIPIIIDNDANMFALAELKYGAGVGHKNLIALTLGSGIGGGIVIEGKVFHGDRGFAGEVGHIVVEPDGVPCGCGSNGCWEQYAASRAFMHLVHRLPKKEKETILSLVENDATLLTAKFTAELANNGNAAASELWRAYGRYLGIGIASLINTLGITTIVIGGGIARSWDLFIDAARAEIMNRTYRKNAEHLKLFQASLGEFTGIVGAASSFFQKN